MPAELGQNQSVTQAVVTEQAELDNNTTPQLVALFKRDGTPFLGDTASVYSVATLLWTEVSPELIQGMLTTPTENPYPYMTAVCNQTNPEINGVYQNMTGAPGTTGNQPIKKIADFPTGESVICSSLLIENTEGTLTPETMVENVKQGGFIACTTLVTDNDNVPETTAYLLYRGDRVQKIEDDFVIIGNRLTDLENP